MKTVTISIKEHLGKGLAQNNNKRNNPALTECKGAFPYEDALQAIELPAQINTLFLNCSFPYPQFITTSNFNLICTATEIYEIVNNQLILKINNLTAGLTWSVLESKDFIYLTNGHIAVTRDPYSGVYSINGNVPNGASICNYNGQVIVASSNISGEGWGLFGWGSINWPN